MGGGWIAGLLRAAPACLLTSCPLQLILWSSTRRSFPLLLLLILPSQAGSGHLAVVERLLAADADPLKLDSRGETAAARALRQGHLEVVRRLLQHGGEMGAEAAEAEAGLTAPDVGACSQVASASRSWQLGFPSGPPSCPCSLSPAALESEQRHYRLLLYHFLQAHAGGCGGAGSSSSSNGGAAARVRQLATPAAVAHAAAGSEALLGALLACGVRPCCVDPRDGSFPLLIAARHRDGWQPMQRLLARGADVNQADSRGDTAAMLLAARPALLGTVRQLLRWSGREEREGREGAPSSSALDLSRLNSEGRDAVGVALAANNRRCGELLLEHQVARQQGALEARTAASPGLQQDSSAAASRSSMPAPRGAPAAEVSAAAVASLAWRLLRGQGARRLADINRPHSGGRHLLVSQVRGGGIACSELLPASCRLPASPLLHAQLMARSCPTPPAPQVSRASRKQLRLLAALPGLDLNARDPLTGRTPLMLAAERGDPGIAQDLLGTGQADVGARDARGATAALLAARAGQGATLRVLLSAGAGGHSVLQHMHSAFLPHALLASLRPLARAMLLLHHPPPWRTDPACADASGDTPLMALARRGQHKLLSELLRGPARASLDAQDSSGWSALHHAAAAGQAQACGVLRGHGADASLLTGNGRTALELARGAGHAPCLPFLKLPASA